MSASGRPSSGSTCGRFAFTSPVVHVNSRVSGFLFGARAIGGSRGELPGQLRLAPLWRLGARLWKTTRGMRRGRPRDQGLEMLTAGTGLRSGDALRSRRVAEGPRGATSSASYALSRPRVAHCVCLGRGLRTAAR
jgi:hypothetical protein